MKRTKELQEFLDKATKEKFGISNTEAIETCTCPACKKKIRLDFEFKDDLSRKEWSISGLCQECQDKTFEM